MAPLTNLCMSGMAPPGEILLSDSLFDPVYLMLVSVRRKEPLNGIIEHSLLIYSILTYKTSCFSTYKPKLMALFSCSHIPKFPYLFVCLSWLNPFTHNTLLFSLLPKIPYLFLSLMAPSLASFSAVSRDFVLSIVARSLFSSLGSSHRRSALSLTS